MDMKKELMKGDELEKFCSTLMGTIPIDKIHFGMDDGLLPRECEALSEYYTHGNRGEGIYLLKTAYTDIKIDGEMDAAYTYGVHIKGDLYFDASLYDGEKTYFDAYMIRGQDGRIYVYVDVFDSELVVNDYFFGGGGASHHADGMEIFLDKSNCGSCVYPISIVADPMGKYQNAARSPGEYAVRLTENGYALEFVFDNDGQPFVSGDEIGFGFYLNDALGWNEETRTYKRSKLKNASVLGPYSLGYLAPSGDIHDALRVSLESASGKMLEPAPTVEVGGDILTAIFERNARVAVIYDRNATAQTVIEARRVTSVLRCAGKKADLFCENKMNESDVYDVEILLGMTGRKESKDLSAELRVGEWGVRICENRIAAIGWCEGEAKAVGDVLCGILCHGINGGKVSEIDAFYRGEIAEIVSDLPKLDGFESVTDVGDGAYQMYKFASSKDEFLEYIDKLVGAGFVRYTENSIGSAFFATMCGMERVVNVQYGGDNERSLRVVVEPASLTALPSLEKPKDAENGTVPCSVTVTDWRHSGCMCMIFKLSNGHFVIVDSDCVGRHTHIYETLKKLSGGEKIIVESWLITHFHGDHLGGFIDYTGCDEYINDTEIRSVVYSFPQKQVSDMAYIHDQENMALFSGDRMEKLTARGTVFYRARTGQKYYFGNSEIEMLWTYEDIMPFNVYVDRSNPTSIGFTVKIAGQKIMITGDSSGEEFTMAVKKYGDELKSDLVQLSHHGQGDGYSPVEFYKTVGAPYVINPGIGDYYGVGEAWARDNARKYFMRGALGRVTVTLPYNGGTFESTRGQ